ncbi:NAD-binding protein [Fomitiporia mediterranea MF3/22]|uniref:NAD-binding protein n=1 Tax=Fomitiporia mediterranea (strain MF3/22) TaxID=694068 RepID=UPI0004409B7D|nr:NAD-binding protein [Fomitiporia mediterranea MF3/22]EJD03062.1 NAD-binding protein [Fomitiporia mediterranea MF3/22]
MFCSANKKQVTAAAAAPPNIPVPSSTRAVVLQNYVSAEHALDLWPSPAGTFDVKEFPIPNPIPEDSLLVRTLYLSNDPGMGLLLSKSNKNDREDVSTLPLGTPFPTYAALARVVRVGGGEGRGPHKVGDIVEVFRSHWSEYVIVKKDKARPRKEIPGVNISSYLGALGISGGTAYFALMGVLKPKKSDTLVVSGAAGAVGNVAIQYAKKVLGLARVVGIAGTDEKCTWLKSIGADEAINYKSATFAQDLVKATPDKVDLYFDNVGGSILDEMLTRMKPHGRVCLVGAMARKHVNEPAVMNNYAEILLNRLVLEGFTANDYLDRMGEAEQALGGALRSGKLILHGAETLVDIQGRIEEIPRVWGGLFAGVNTGKLVTKVAD